MRKWIAVCALLALTQASLAAWNGSAKVPKVVSGAYEITTPEELIGFLDSIAPARIGDKTLNAYLKNDIVFGEDSTKLCFKRWTRNADQNYFSGVFDGKGHTVYGLNAEKALFKSVGMGAGVVRNLDIANSSFGSDSAYATAAITEFQQGVVQNVNVINTKVIAAGNAGAIAASLIASEDELVVILNCNVVGGSVTGGTYVGGIVGQLLGRVYGSNNSARVLLAGNAQADSIPAYIGGIAGSAEVRDGSALESCINRGDVELTGSRFIVYAGGIAGEISGGAENLQNYGNITAGSLPSAKFNWSTNVSLWRVAGIAGQISLDTYYATSALDMLNDGNIAISVETNMRGSVYAGGIAGSLVKPNVRNTLNRGSIEINNNTEEVSVNAGGFAGWAEMQINENGIAKVKNRGSIYAEGNKEVLVGGLIGSMSGLNNMKLPQLRESFNYGDVTAVCPADNGTVKVGGILAMMHSMNVSDVYNRGNVLLKGYCSYRYVGGILADLGNYGADSIVNAYSAAASVKGAETAGGVIGEMYQAEQASNVYFDGSLVDLNAYGYVYSSESPCPQCKKTTAEMQSDEMLATLNTVNGTEADRHLWVRRGGYPVFTFDSVYQNDSVYFNMDKFVLPPSRVENDTTLYTISTADEMRAFLELGRILSTKTYKAELANDIVMGKDSLHLSMRKMSVDSVGRCVSMQFDGKGHTVYGLDMERSMFHCLDSNSLVQNFTIANSRFENDLGYSAAGVTIKNNGCVRNVTIRNSLVRGDDAAAGLVVQNFKTLLNLKNENTSVYSNGVAGGVVGYSYEAVISGASNSGKVSGRVAGGIAGSTNGYGQGPNIVSQASNTGAVLVTADTIVFAGGILGYALRTTISDSYNTGLVQGSVQRGDIMLGGIVGLADSINSISGVGNWGRVHVVSSDRAYAGGLVGRFSGLTLLAGGTLYHAGGFIRSFNYGPVHVGTSKDTSYAGGIIGYAANLVLQDDYNRGIVKNEGDSQTRFTGGMIAGGNFVTIAAGYSFTDELSGSGVATLAYGVENDGNVLQMLYYGKDKLNSPAVVELAEGTLYEQVEEKTFEQMKGELEYLNAESGPWVFGNCLPRMEADTTSVCAVNVVEDFFEEGFVDSVGYLLDVVYADSTGGDPHGTTPVAPKPRDMKANALPMHVAVSGRDITVSGLRQGDAVLVLDMNGRLVTSARIHGVSATLNVSRAGFYIVRNAGQSRKVRVR